MQRIKWIRDQLDEWGERCIRQGDGGTMQRVTSSVYDGREKVDCATTAQPVWLDLELDAIEAAINALGKHAPELLKAVREVHYKGRFFPIGVNAKRLQITRQTLHLRLCHADMHIEAWLSAPERRQAA